MQLVRDGKECLTLHLVIKLYFLCDMNSASLSRPALALCCEKSQVNNLLDAHLLHLTTVQCICIFKVICE